MKLREGKKILAYDFAEYKWVKAKIVNIDNRDGVVTIKDSNGHTYTADISELDDRDCYKEG